MKRFINIVIIILVLFTGCKNTTDTIKKESIASRTIYHNGEIITMEGSQASTQEAVVVEDKHIIFVGNKQEAKGKYPNALAYDLNGNTMMPGFIEQHMHPFLGALTLAMPVIAPEDWVLPTKTWPAANSNEEYLSLLRAIEAKMDKPDEVLFSWGYHQFFHGELNRSILDEVSANRPIAIWHRSVHEFYLNSAMIDLLKLDQQGINDTGDESKAQSDLTNGHFFENGALLYLLPRIAPYLGTQERFVFGLNQMVELLHSKGVTAYNEPGAFIFPGTEQLYMKILGAERTPMYSYFIPETKTPFKTDPDNVLNLVQEITSTFPAEGKIRFFDKQIKILGDGAIVSLLMQMKDGYLDGHEGEWIQGPEEMEQITKVFWEQDYQIHIHTNGDLGLDEVIKVIQRRMAEYPREDHRTTIVHFANSTDEQVAKLAELGCIISANPYYVTAFSDKYSEMGLGPERAQAMVRLGTAEDLGISVSLHSDLPIAPSDPLFLAWCATTRETNEGNIHRPDLALSLHAALKAITIDAAYSWRMEDKLGSIKEGKIANFTILDRNPYTVGAEGLRDIAVLATVFEGREFPVQD